MYTVESYCVDLPFTIQLELHSPSSNNL